MEQRLSVVTLGVADVERSGSFYERLGWKRSAASAEGIVFFQAGGMVLALYGREALAEDAAVASPGAGFRAFSLALNVRSRDEVDAALREAAEAGADIVKPAAEAFWGGYSGYFGDPDGFLWEVAWNPFWTVDKEGGIKLPDA